MTSKKFNKFTDDLQITATILRSASNKYLQLETSNNLIINASNIELTNNGDLSTNRINANNYHIYANNRHMPLDEYIKYVSETEVFDLTGGLDSSFNNVDISGDLKFTDPSTKIIFYNNSTIDISNSALVIDPAPASGDSSGTVIIRGSLEVRGTTTTINSNEVDISNKLLIIASDISNISDASGAGIVIGTSDLSLSIKYDNASEKFVFSKGIDICGSITCDSLTANGITIGDTTLSNEILTKAIIGSDLITSNINTKLFASRSTFAIENSGNVLCSDISDVSNTWISPPNYRQKITLRSINSAVKIKFKVNYKTSTAANQFISFRVTRGSNPHNVNDVVFQDCSLGSNIALNLHNIYNGNFIDIDNNIEEVEYHLHYRLDTPANSNINIPYGILGGPNYSNYISLQELYCP